MFRKNIGATDRALRIIVGIVLITLAFMGQIGLWGYIGIVPLVTALISLCPLYSLLGISTGKK